MQIQGWRYYNHAALPTTAPHENVDITPIKDGNIWRLGGGALLARWTTEWDCGYETDWWYVIKDTPFDINVLKSKRRYEINKGKKNFQTKKIIARKLSEEIFSVAEKAFAAYPEKYRPTLDKVAFINEIKLNWDSYTVFGAFDNDGVLCGYAYLIEHDDYCEFSVLKTDPAEERNGVNASLIEGICNYYNQRIANSNFYICDGSRAIRHQTHFQDYLEKYFGFRKSYCHLHIKYRWYIKATIKMLKPFYRILSKTENGMMWNIVSLIEMDRLCER